jgi:hypothetical protein
MGIQQFYYNPFTLHQILVQLFNKLFVKISALSEVVRKKHWQIKFSSLGFHFSLSFSVTCPKFAPRKEKPSIYAPIYIIFQAH